MTRTFVFLLLWMVSFSAISLNKSVQISESVNNLKVKLCSDVADKHNCLVMVEQIIKTSYSEGEKAANCRYLEPRAKMTIEGAKRCRDAKEFLEKTIENKNITQ